MSIAPVVLGVDAAPGSFDALVWALVECRARGCGLRLVHACRSQRTAGERAGEGDWETADPAVVVDAHVDLARQAAPDVPVEASVVAGEPVAALLEAADDAALVVLGSHGRAGLAESALGSVTQRVAVHAHCPVVVVPPNTLSSEWARPQRVAVGVADTWAGRRALDHAVLRARLTGATVVLVGSRPDDQGGRCRAAEELAKVRAELVAEHPGLRVEGLAGEADAAAAVITASRAAQLVVLGCHHSDDPWTSRLGAVPSAVLPHTGCPVELVGQLR